MNAVINCYIVYIQTEIGFEAKCINYNLGCHQAESIKELTEIFRNECAQLLKIDNNFVSVQINRVRKL
jgi:hypothetical protein